MRKVLIILFFLIPFFSPCQFNFQSGKIYTTNFSNTNGGYILFKNNHFLYFELSNNDVTAINEIQFSSIIEGEYIIDKNKLKLDFNGQEYSSFSTDTVNYKTYGNENWDSTYIYLKSRSTCGNNCSLAIFFVDKMLKPKFFNISETQLEFGTVLPSKQKIEKIEISKLGYSKKILPYQNFSNVHKYEVHFNDQYEVIHFTGSNPLVLDFKEQKESSIFFKNGRLFKMINYQKNELLFKNAFSRLFKNSIELKNKFNFYFN